MFQWNNEILQKKIIEYSNLDDKFVIIMCKGRNRRKVEMTRSNDH